MVQPLLIIVAGILFAVLVAFLVKWRRDERRARIEFHEALRANIRARLDPLETNGARRSRALANAAKIEERMAELASMISKSEAA